MTASCSAGSNGSPASPNDNQAELGQDRVELIGHRLECAGQITVRPGPIDVVEHRQQRRQHTADGDLAHGNAVALDPLAVVGVLGLQPLQIGRALGHRGLEGGDLL